MAGAGAGVGAGADIPGLGDGRAVVIAAPTIGDVGHGRGADHDPRRPPIQSP